MGGDHGEVLSDRQLVQFNARLTRRPSTQPAPADPTPAELNSAARRLADKDPFVRARTERIIARKVGHDNDGYEVAWERNFWDVHSIWTVRPDGTMSDALFKQHLGQPMSLRHARSIAGTSKLVAIASGHHTFAYGPVVIVDPTAGLNNAAGIQILTPGSYPQENSPHWKGPAAWRNPVTEGGVADAGGFYQTPYAVSEKCFLVSYCYACPGTPSWGGRGLERLCDLTWSTCAATRS